MTKANNAKKIKTDSLRDKGARVRGQYFETQFSGTVERFDIFGNGKGANEIQIGILFDSPMPIKINGEFSDVRDGVNITAVPDCWSKSSSRKRGFDRAVSKCGAKWVEVC